MTTVNAIKIAVMTASLTLAACAYSPQQITVQPQFTVAGERYGKGLPVTVVVEDLRSQKVVGSRGGAYPDTSTITIGNDITQAIARSAEATLAAQGFNINSQQTSVAQYKIIIDELVYQKLQGSIRGQIDLKAVLRTEISGSGENYRGRYQTAHTRQLPLGASEEKNTALINALLSETLVRVFEDPKAKVFFSNL